MRRRGLDQRQRRLLRDHGIEADIMAGAPDADLAQIHEFALDVLATIKERFPEAALVFDATGGNKLMMLGFVEVFRGDSRVIYADTQHGRIETLPPARGRAEMSRPMDNVLDVPAYLRAQGFLYRSARSNHKDGLDYKWQTARASSASVCSGRQICRGCAARQHPIHVRLRPLFSHLPRRVAVVAAGRGDEVFAAGELVGGRLRSRALRKGGQRQTAVTAASASLIGDFLVVSPGASVR
jgi:hypothetical protein